MVVVVDVVGEADAADAAVVVGKGQTFLHVVFAGDDGGRGHLDPAASSAVVGGVAAVAAVAPPTDRSTEHNSPLEGTHPLVP